MESPFKEPPPGRAIPVYFPQIVPSMILVNANEYFFTQISSYTVDFTLCDHAEYTPKTPTNCLMGLGVNLISCLNLLKLTKNFVANLFLNIDKNSCANSQVTIELGGAPIATMP